MYDKNITKEWNMHIGYCHIQKTQSSLKSYTYPIKVKTPTFATCLCNVRQLFWITALWTSDNVFGAHLSAFFDGLKRIVPTRASFLIFNFIQTHPILSVYDIVPMTSRCPNPIKHSEYYKCLSIIKAPWYLSVTVCPYITG
jgi:hypothetical protein